MILLSSIRSYRKFLSATTYCLSKDWLINFVILSVKTVDNEEVKMLKGKQILVVEDNEANAMVFVDLLELCDAGTQWPASRSLRNKNKF